MYPKRLRRSDKLSHTHKIVKKKCGHDKFYKCCCNSKEYSEHPSSTTLSDFAHAERTAYIGFEVKSGSRWNR